MRLFVYGTLKRRGRLHHYLRKQQFIGEAQTIPEYMLFGIPDQYNYPMIYRVGPEHGVSVKGEVYEISESRREVLDQVEGYPSLYDRETIQLTDGTEATVYIPRSYPDKRYFPQLGDNWPVDYDEVPA